MHVNTPSAPPKSNPDSEENGHPASEYQWMGEAYPAFSKAHAAVCVTESEHKGASTGRARETVTPLAQQALCSAKARTASRHFDFQEVGASDSLGTPEQVRMKVAEGQY